MTRRLLAAVVSAALAVGFVEARGTVLTSDLSITKTDRHPTYTPGIAFTYTIVVANAGPDDTVGAVVTDAVTTLPQVLSASWSCAAVGGATCTAGPTTGNISDTVDIPVGGTLTYSLTVVPRTTATGDLINAATITPPAGTIDPGPGPDTATDTDTMAAIFYVATTGADTATCGPVAAPCKTIQAAIDLAKAGDTILVQSGTYNECIVLVPGVGVGGVLVEANAFLTGSTNATTILDGATKCDAASTTPGPVVTMSDGSSLRGFTIRNGGGSGVVGLGAVTISDNVITTNATASTGGGIQLTTGANLTDPQAISLITTNTIKSNTSARDGAGIFVAALATGIPSVVEITGNTIKTNTAGDGTAGVLGAGLTVFTDTASATDSSSVLVTGNTIESNIAKNASGNASLAYGGGIFVATGKGNGLGAETVTIGGSAAAANGVRNNVSEGLGGGMSINVQPSPGATHKAIVDENNVNANTGGFGGGGLHLFARALDLTSGPTPSLTLLTTGNSITGNHAQGGLTDPLSVGGGGIRAELQSGRTAGAVAFEISGNTLELNDATTHGGGASLLASADDDPSSNGAVVATEAFLWFHNNLVAKNLARDATAGTPSGGGIHARVLARGAQAKSRVTQSFLTVVENETELGSGGIEWEDVLLTDTLGGLGSASLTMDDSIVAANEGYGVGTTVPLDPATVVVVSYTDAFGNVSGNYQSTLADPTGTSGNVSVDPALDTLFLPRLCGPTVDQGDPAISPANEPLPNGNRVNLGHLGNTTSATRTLPDLNGDGTVDGLDVMGVAVAFGALSTDPRYFTAADRNFDDIVDGNDLAFVSAFYAQTCP